ncbi:hypothetical protein [Xanthobacter variabilis]|uniref:hypothetical protein n=1 Tax=Xanthobacter variabilis TaxID=3119932 RepID=UPI00372A15D3
MGIDEGADNDRIGRLGELEFARLCELAKLGCSKVEPDRTGKDFIVEFPPPAIGEWQSLDRRAAPLQLAVQVKTIRSHRRSAVLTLSVAERLARDLRPSLICVFKIDANDQFVALHLIHFQGAPLGRVLARLRAATGSDKELNELSLTFATNAGNKIEYSPPSLKAALASFVPDGMKSYADAKAQQIEELGFNEVRILGTLNIAAIDAVSLADGFLGLSPLEGVSMTVMERRFEIDLPLLVPEGPGKLTITPQPVGRAIAEFYNSEERVLIDVDVYLPPKDIFDSGGKKIVFSWPMGRVSIGFEGPNNCNFTQNFRWGDLRSAKEWLAGLLVSEIVGSGLSTMAVTATEGQRLMDGAFTIEPMPSHSGVIGLVRRYLSILDAAHAEDIPVSLEALYENRKAIDETWQYLEGGTDVTFGVVGNPTQELDDQDGIYITAAQLGDGRVFGLAVPMSFSFAQDGDDGQGRGKIGKQTAAIELLREPVLESYDHFVRKVEKLARCKLRIVVRLEANPDVS